MASQLYIFSGVEIDPDRVSEIMKALDNHLKTTKTKIVFKIYYSKISCSYYIGTEIFSLPIVSDLTFDILGCHVQGMKRIFDMGLDGSNIGFNDIKMYLLPICSTKIVYSSLLMKESENKETLTVETSVEADKEPNKDD